MSAAAGGGGLRPDRLRAALTSQISSQLLRLLLVLALGGWLARYLGPSALGQLSYVTALIGVLAPLGSLGVKGSLATLLIEPEPIPGLVSTALALELAGTLLLALVVLPVAWFSADGSVPVLLSLGVLANLFNSAEVYEAELLCRQRGTVVGRVGILKVLTGAVATVTALLARAPLWVFGGVQALQNVFWAVALIQGAKAPSLRRLRRELNAEAAVALLRRGTPLLLAALSIMLYMKSDQVMLQWLRGSDDVGQYSIAVRMAESLYFIPVILADTFLPRIAGDTQKSGFSPELRRFYRLAWLIGIAMMLGCMVLLPPCVPLIFGDQYRPAMTALLCLGPATFSACTGCASGAWMNANGRVGLYAQRSAFGAAVNISLNCLMIPRFGILGAALTTSISHLASVYLYPLFIPGARANTLRLLNPW